MSAVDGFPERVADWSRGRDRAGWRRALDGLEAERRPGASSSRASPGSARPACSSELRDRAEERGHIVLHSQAAEFEQDLPFGAVAEALDPYRRLPARDRLAASTTLTAELAPVLPSIARVARRPARARSATSATGRIAPCAGCSSGSRRTKPLVLALDDLHWGDDASIELLAALLRRPPEAPVLLALAFRPGHAPERLSVAVAAPLVVPARARPAQRGGGGRAARRHRRELGGGDLPPRRRQPLLPPAARADRASRCVSASGPADRFAEVGVPAAVAASLAEEVGVLSAEARRFIEAAAVAGEPFEPDLARRGRARCRRPRGSRPSTTCWPATSSARPRCPGDSSSATRCSGEPSTSRSPAARGWPLIGRAADALAARRRPRRRAGAPRRAGRRPGDMEAVEVLLEAAAAAAAASARDRGAMARRGAAADAGVRARAPGRGADGARLAPCAPPASSSAAGRPCSRPSRCCRPTRSTAGRADDLVCRGRALARPPRRRPRAPVAAWDELEDPRDAPQGAALAVELAVDGLYTLDFERTLELAGPRHSRAPAGSGTSR